jgi:hypothetical protein
MYTFRVTRTLSVQLPEAVVPQLERAALDQGVSVEHLVQVSVEEKIERDMQFESAATRVLEKNAELYRRLA